MFIHMSIHYPYPEKEGLLLESMNRFGAAMEGRPGIVAKHIMKDEATGRIIGMGIWESRDQWKEAHPFMEAAVKGDDFDSWEERRPEIFHLSEPKNVQ